jgi:nucleoside-diphosphate-sugar epimerase
MGEIVLVTGATCPTGEVVVQALSQRLGLTVRCLMRQSSRAPWLLATGVERLTGNLDTGDGVDAAMAGIDTVVHIAGIRFVRPVLRAMQASGVQRAVFVNTTGVFSRFKSASEVYRLLEGEMQDSLSSMDTDYVVIRPTMIFGNDRDRNVCKFFHHFQRHSLFPMFGDGTALIQPIYYRDVAAAILASYDALGTAKGFYNISGAAPVPYRQFIEEIAQLCGRRPVFLHLPVRLTAGAVEAVRKVYPRFPLKGEQIWRTTESRAFDHDAAARDLGFRPLSVPDGLRLEAAALGILHGGAQE